MSTRTFSNFLMLEGTLEEIQNVAPVGTSVIMPQTVGRLLNPQVKIIEENCVTLLGDIVPISYDLEGYIDGTHPYQPVSLKRGTGDINEGTTLLNYIKRGVYSIHVRKLHSCQSNGGVCQTCYRGSFIDSPQPQVGTVVSVPSSYILSSSSFTSDPSNRTYQLTLSTDQYDYLVLVTGGNVVSNTTYTLGDSSLTFNDSYPLSSEPYVVHHYITDSEPLLGYLSTTYSGSLLGLSPLPTEPLIIDRSLYYEFLTPPYLHSMLLELLKYPNIPKQQIDYAEKIHEPLEQALYFLYLYLVYSGITV